MTASKITPGRAGRAIVRKSAAGKTVAGRAIVRATAAGETVVDETMAGKTMVSKTVNRAIGGKAIAVRTVVGEAAARKRRVRKKGGVRWNGRRRALFLAALTETANVRRSAKTAGMSLAAAYALKRRDPAFARAWKEALEIGYNEVEMALLRESLNGSERVETVQEGVNKTLKYIKTVRSFNFSVAVRLFMAHRAEVLAFRRERGDEAAAATGTIEETEHYLALIRARLGGAEDEVAAGGEIGSGGEQGVVAAADPADAPGQADGRSEADGPEARR